MTEKEVKDELERMLTVYMGFSIIGFTCLILFLTHNLG